jgi:hypothetical protein
LASSFDPVGNRLSRTRTIGQGQPVEDEMTYDEANRLTTLNEEEWEHDADGNGSKVSWDNASILVPNK